MKTQLLFVSFIIFLCLCGWGDNLQSNIQDSTSQTSTLIGKVSDRYMILSSASIEELLDSTNFYTTKKGYRLSGDIVIDNSGSEKNRYFQRIEKKSYFSREQRVRYFNAPTLNEILFKQTHDAFDGNQYNGLADLIDEKNQPDYTDIIVNFNDSTKNCEVFLISK
ncbi:MAG: hypothetical protein KDC73_11470 [Ignavibacteriae bacterium]|nr:hypothetical protein [Ignavibacteriota bacterium]MCB9243540.1 hypothetical protein [Ignavibacteriales bacterium]